jgi:hypothetical protein
MARSIDRPEVQKESVVLEAEVLQAEVLPPVEAGTTSLSRREVLGWSGGLLAASVLAGLPEAASARALPPAGGPRPRPRAASNLSQIQYPFWSGEWNMPYRYETIRFADFNGDGRKELLGRSSGGMIAFQYDPQIMQFRHQYLDRDNNQGWLPMPPGPSWLDTHVDTGQPLGGQVLNNSFQHERYYRTIRAGDIDNDGQAELVMRWWDGIHTFKWVPGTDATTGETRRYWKEIGSVIADYSDANNWDQPQYYETFLLTDIDRDGQEELLARAPGGMQAWQWDGTDWSQLESGTPAWTDDAGYDQPQYYETIRAMTLPIGGLPQGVGALVIRGPGGINGPGGIEVWFFADSGWSRLSLDTPPIWTDAAGWNQPKYYSTILVANLLDGAADALIGRGPGGVDGWYFGEGVAELATGPWSDAAGYDQPEYYETMRAGDIDGDQLDELLIRGPKGIEVWKFLNSGGAGSWTQLPAGPAWSDAAGWNVQQYYETIQLADLDGDGQAELFGIGPNGIEIWKYNKTTQQWFRPTAQFPPFTGGQLTAYQSLSNTLTRNTSVGQVNDVRRLYKLLNDATTFGTWASEIPTLSAPAGTAPADWNAVTTQIALEAELCATAQSFFDNVVDFHTKLQPLWQDGAQTAFNDLQSDATAAFNAASAALAQEEAIWNTVTAVLGSILGLASAGIGAAGLVAASLAAAIGSAAANCAWGGLSFLATTSPSLDTATELATGAFEGTMTKLYTNWLKSFGSVHDSVFADYGLLNVYGAEIAWLGDTAQSASLQEGANGFELFAWQVLSPTVWFLAASIPGLLEPPGGWPYPQYTMDARLLGLNDPSDPFPGPYTLGLVVTGSNWQSNSAYFPQLTNLQSIFNAGTDSPAGLGQLLYDVLLDTNGWQIPTGDVSWDQMPDYSSFTDLYTTSFNPNVAATPGWTTVPGVPEEAAASIIPAAAPRPAPRRRRRPLFNVAARTTLHRKGPGEVTVEVGLHNDSAAAVSHVRCERLELILLGVGWDARPKPFHPVNGQLTQRRRLRRGHSVRERVIFKVPPAALRQATGAMLVLSGSFLGRGPNGGWQRYPFNGSKPIRFTLPSRPQQLEA